VLPLVHHPILHQDMKGSMMVCANVVTSLKDEPYVDMPVCTFQSLEEDGGMAFRACCGLPIRC
jgi:hypothetical protein